MYELSDPNRDAEVVARLLEVGYRTSWSDRVTAVRYQLPKFMVWKMDTTLQDALLEIERVVQLINNTTTPSGNLKVVKCITLGVTPWAGKPMPTNL